jgi:ribose/xylose/arabinose/galactoside ABC-type transport system permease subunit
VDNVGMKARLSILNLQQSGLLMIILGLGTLLTFLAGSHVDRQTGETVNNFLNPSTLMQLATDASFFAIMAVGMTCVIISGGIDLSVGSIYALSGVVMGLMIKGDSGPMTALAGLGICCGVGILCGFLNGLMVTGLGVHPFIITLGTLWVYRGIAFVISKAESILVPGELTDVAKATLGLRPGLYPVPLLTMLAVAAVWAVFFTRTAMGRRVFAVGGNAEASRYSGLPIRRVLTGVYTISGLCAGLAAYLGSAYFGSVSSADGSGYELFVIASAVVGGASLSGGRGSAFGAMLGAVLIALMYQSIRTLGLDQNYQWIIIGTAIIVAVLFDRLNARFSESRLSRRG